METRVENKGGRAKWKASKKTSEVLWLMLYRWTNPDFCNCERNGQHSWQAGIHGIQSPVKPVRGKVKTASPLRKARRSTLRSTFDSLSAVQLSENSHRCSTCTQASIKSRYLLAWRLLLSGFTCLRKGGDFLLNNEDLLESSGFRLELKWWVSLSVDMCQLLRDWQKTQLYTRPTWMTPSNPVMQNIHRM